MHRRTPKAVATLVALGNVAVDQRTAKHLEIPAASGDVAPEQGKGKESRRRGRRTAKHLEIPVASRGVAPEQGEGRRRQCRPAYGVASLFASGNATGKQGVGTRGHHRIAMELAMESKVAGGMGLKVAGGAGGW